MTLTLRRGSCKGSLGKLLPPHGRLLKLMLGRFSLQHLKARAVLVDMEEGVVNGLMRGNLGMLALQTPRKELLHHQFLLATSVLIPHLLS